MTGLKNPTNALRKGITGIEDATKMGEVDMSCFAPILDREVLYIDMTGAFCGLVGIYHFDGGLIILVDRGGSKLSKAKLRKNRV